MLAQSPNNAGWWSLVSDESGLVVKDAKVTVVNNQTRATREAMSGGDGSASFPALSLFRHLHGDHRPRQGFADETRGDVSFAFG